MHFITSSFGENFRSFDLDPRTEACPISNDGSSIATYLSNTFRIFAIIDQRFISLIAVEGHQPTRACSTDVEY